MWHSAESLEPRLMLSAYALSPLASFDFDNGRAPSALVRDANGNLFGIASLSGPGSSESLFEIPAGSGNIVDVAPFDFSTVGLPDDLIVDGSGNLFGVASNGGPDGAGTVFEVASGSSTITVLASFNGFDGWGPNSLLLDADGNLYGTTSGGGPGYNPPGNNLQNGTVFEIIKGAGVITDLGHFSGTNGVGPVSLTLDANGNVFGATSAGGPDYDPPSQHWGNGTIFEIVRGSGQVTDLATFDGSNGKSPGDVILDGSGNIYGLAREGGAGLSGVFFELAQGSGTIGDLASFNYYTDGATPSHLVVDRLGNFYGITPSAGPQSGGTVFAIPAGTDSIVILQAFDGTRLPPFPSSLTVDSSGNLYGTTQNGGVDTDGSVFQLAPTPTTLALPAASNSATFAQDSDHRHIDWAVGSQHGQILIADAGGLLITGNGSADTLTLDPSRGNPLPDVLRLNGTFTVNGSLTLGATQTIELRGGSLIVPYNGGTSPLAGIQTYLHSGQIISSAAAGFAVADVDSGTAVTSSVRLLGDSNGDGTVDFADLLVLAQSYNTPRTDWAHGDFNYDGTTGFADLLLLAQEYGRTASPAALVAAAWGPPTSQGSSDVIGRRRRARG